MKNKSNKRFIKLSLILVIIVLGSVNLDAQEVKYTFSKDGWNADSLGNHRALVRFDGSQKVVLATIEWRRRDYDVDKKNIIVEDVKTHKRILNVTRGQINREVGEVYFEPISGAGDYYIYYMPYKASGRSNYPKNTYPNFVETADENWLTLMRNSANVGNAKLIEIQSVDEFNSFYPMEVIAKASEIHILKDLYFDKPFIVFPEDRLHPIKMTKDLPQRWVMAAPKSAFDGETCKGEYFAFQFGVYANQDIRDVRVVFSDLKAENGSIIPSSMLNCINTNGVNWDGKPLTKRVDVAKGVVQSLWCGVDVLSDAKEGVYKGTATISIDNTYSKDINLSITVNNQTLSDGGVNEPWKQTRLKWLNTTMAQENTIIPPYIPLEVKGNTISLLGRKVELDKDGFPKKIQTFFTPEMTSFSKTPKDVIVQPIKLVCLNEANIEEVWKDRQFKFVEKTAGTVTWESTSISSKLQMKVNASLEFDGFISYKVEIAALEDVALGDIKMSIPMNPDASKYMMGLGQKGGYRPENFEWKWDVANKNQDGAWLGDVNAGLQFSLRAENYVRPLNTNFYLQKPLNLPPSWGNSGNGGINITKTDKSVLVNSYSGARKMKKGEKLYYNFNLIITPFHPINTDFQWGNRFYHKYSPIDTVIKRGSTIINIHHANEINPYINYPFIAHKQMKEYIDEAHSKGLKVKIYNTVRELSNRAYETFPLRSLGHEVYSPGAGGGFSWLQEHVGDDYIAAWFVPELKDAAIINSGMSRWHNYYVEGLNWLVNNIGIDGLYLDDVAFDRTTMKRVKRVLTQNNHPGILDLHSANQYNKRDGFINSGMLYMELFPYLNRLWFGEYFDYNESPDFFLTEVSGIPFGLMGEMLEGGGNPWRGMVYGMTNRMPWTENSDPRPIWKAWDDFGNKGSQMIGYWVENCPVKTNRPDVLATVYKKDGAALISIASWAKEDVTVQLTIDWKALDLNLAKASLVAPEIKSFQQSFNIKPTDSFVIPKGKGFLLVLSEKNE